ncbi:hypothetical protein SDC9_194769 [bioreactor metagenome]|uniref:Uncharacterized protein n=1 Tax=bioreactor metagenome TaxID=1076179 RepID=A0A645I7D2_9ZZZZ
MEEQALTPFVTSRSPTIKLDTASSVTPSKGNMRHIILDRYCIIPDNFNADVITLKNIMNPPITSIKLTLLFTESPKRVPILRPSFFLCFKSSFRGLIFMVEFLLSVSLP